MLARVVPRAPREHLAEATRDTENERAGTMPDKRVWRTDRWKPCAATALKRHCFGVMAQDFGKPHNHADIPAPFVSGCSGTNHFSSAQSTIPPEPQRNKLIAHLWNRIAQCGSAKSLMRPCLPPHTEPTLLSGRHSSDAYFAHAS